MNTGLAILKLDNVTGFPPTCNHEKPNELPFGSKLALPSRVTYE
jgi:hypothetical protein